MRLVKTELHGHASEKGLNDVKEALQVRRRGAQQSRRIIRIALRQATGGHSKA